MGRLQPQRNEKQVEEQIKSPTSSEKVGLILRHCHDYSQIAFLSGI